MEWINDWVGVVSTIIFCGAVGFIVFVLVRWYID